MRHLSRRQQEIVNLLSSKTTPMTGLELADILGVSLRTIQGDIRKINKESYAISSSGDGYSLAPSFVLDSFTQAQSAVDDSAEDQALLRLIMGQSGRITVDDLAEHFFLSTSTVERKLRQARKQIEAFDLAIIKRRGKIHLEGNEVDKRRLISTLIADEASTSFSSLEDIEAWVGDLDLSRIQIAIERAMDECEVRIKPGYKQAVLTNLGIAVHRMRNGSYICDYHPVISESGIEAAIAERFCELYKDHYKIAPGQSDIAYLGSLLLGQIETINQANEKTWSSHWSDSNEFVNRVNAIVNNVFASFLLHPESSQALFTFAMHVNALIERCHGFQYEKTETVENIKMSCPFIYELSVLISRELEDEFEIQISNGEMGFICIHVGMLIESLLAEDKARIMLDCDNYQGLSDRLLEQLERKFSDIATILRPDDTTDNAIDKHEIDLVITTRRVDSRNPRMISISPFCTSSDFLKIESALGLWHSHFQTKRIERLLRPFFDDRLFFLSDMHPELVNRQRIIEFLSKHMEGMGYVQNDFYKSVLQRENLSSTCFFDLFAVPHSIEMNSKKTIASIFLNPNGVPWGEGQAKIIILIAVCREDRQRFMEIYNSIVRSLCDEVKASKIAKSRSLEEFLELIYLK